METVYLVMGRVKHDEDFFLSQLFYTKLRADKAVEGFKSKGMMAYISERQIDDLLINDWEEIPQNGYKGDA